MNEGMNVAFKPRKRQHLCHILIFQYPKSQMISSLISQYQYDIKIFPSPTSDMELVHAQNRLVNSQVERGDRLVLGAHASENKVHI